MAVVLLNVPLLPVKLVAATTLTAAAASPTVALFLDILPH